MYYKPFFVTLSNIPGLKKQSADYFTLSEGLAHPRRRFVAEDEIPENIKGNLFQLSRIMRKRVFGVSN